MYRQGCRTGSRNCSWRGPAGAVVTRGRCWLGLAVAGRPLTEDLLAGITGLEPGAVRGGLRDLAAARLLAADSPGGRHRPRHALLAEAVAADMLAGERMVLHERTARALVVAGRLYLEDVERDVVGIEQAVEALSGRTRPRRRRGAELA